MWIVCSGNGALALGMADFCRALPFPGDAYLLVDYPGYGECEGSPDPDTIRENLRSAAALIAAEEFKLRRAVPISPFTSMMEMTQVVLKVPLGFIVRHRFDNRTGLAALKEADGLAWLFHGTRDEVIPVGMSRTLAAEFPKTMTFKEIPDADHDSIIGLALQPIMQAMGESRRPKM